MKNKHKFKVGQKVLYQNVLGIIESQSITFSGKLTYSLVAVDDLDMTCTALENECEEYVGQDFEDKLGSHKFAAAATIRKVDNLTDKYFRDGNH